MTTAAQQQHAKRAQAATVACRGCRGTNCLGLDGEGFEIECHHCVDGTMTVAQVTMYDKQQRDDAEWGF